jgi:hypothetical protein
MVECERKSSTKSSQKKNYILNDNQKNISMEKEYHVIRIIRRHVNGKINAPIKWWIISESNLIVCLHDRIITK